MVSSDYSFEGVVLCGLGLGLGSGVFMHKGRSKGRRQWETSVYTFILNRGDPALTLVQQCLHAWGAAAEGSHRVCREKYKAHNKHHVLEFRI